MAKPAYLSDSSEVDSDTLTISEISTNQPDYHAKIYSKQDKLTEDEHLKLTENRLKDLAKIETSNLDIKFRNEKDQKNVKQDLRKLYKNLTGAMCSYAPNDKLPARLSPVKDDTFTYQSDKDSNFYDNPIYGT